MAIKIQNTTVITDDKNVSNINVVTANTYYGDGSNLTGINRGDNIVPGTLQYFTGIFSNTYPSSDWLLCDGSIYNKSQYSNLSSTIGIIPNSLNDGWVVSDANIIDFTYNPDDNYLYGINSQKILKSNDFFQTNTSTQKPVTIGSLKEIAYGNGTFVAVGTSREDYGPDNGGLITSTDGVSWKALGYQTVRNRINKIDNSFFVAGDGYVAKSTDGIYWNINTLNGALKVNTPTYDIASNGNSILASGERQIFISTDNGDTWSNTSLSGTKKYQGIAYGNGTYVAVNNAGAAVYSTDDFTTYGTTTAFGSNLFDVEFFDSKFIAVGAGGGGYYSINGGSAWTPITTNLTKDIINLNIYNNKLIATTINGEIRTSTNGITWDIPHIKTTDVLNSYAFNFSGSNNYIMRTTIANNIVTSTNFTNWNYLPNGFSDIGTATITRGLECGIDNNYYLVLRNPSGSVIRTKTSSDGINWYNISLPALAGLTSLDYHSNTIVGYVNSNTVYTLDSTSNSWFKVGSIGFGTSASGIYGIYANNTFLLTGRQVYSTSTDGFNWVTRDGNLPTTSSIYGFSYANNDFYHYGANGLLAQSSNGIVWTAVTSGTPYAIYDLTYANNLYVLCGGTGTIRTSSNGVTWTARSAGTSTYRTITYDKGLYITGGLAGVIRTSTDGITWTVRTSNTTYDIFKIANANNQLYYCGGNATGGIIGTSTDGITWNTISTVSGYQFTNLSYDAGKFVVTSNAAGRIYQSANIQTLSPVATGAGSILNNVLYNSANGLFTLYTAENPQIYFSTNLTTWTPVYNNVTDSDFKNLPNIIKLANTTYYLANNTSSNFTLYKSNNFIRKTIVKSFEAVNGTDSILKKLSNNRYLAIWNNGLRQRVSTSTALETGWTTTVSMNAGGWATGNVMTISDIDTNNVRYVAVDSGNIKYTNTMSLSSAVDTGIRINPTGGTAFVKWNGNKFIVIKSDTANGYNDVLTSNDGISWISTSNINVASSNSADFSDKFVVFSGNKDEILYTNDGETWQGNYITLPEKFTTGINVNNKLVTYTLDKMYVSSNGNISVWGDNIVPKTNNLHSVTYANNRFIAGGVPSNGFITSTDGYTWQNISVPTTSTIYNVDYVNGKYFYMGAQSGWSDNLITWNTKAFTTAAYNSNVVYYNGVYYFERVGTNLIKSSDLINFSSVIIDSQSTAYETFLSKIDNILFAEQRVGTSTYGNYVTTDGFNWVYIGSNVPAHILGKLNDNYMAIGRLGGFYYTYPYTYNTNTQFAVPIQLTSPVFGNNALFIKT